MSAHRLEADASFPNNPRLPALIYSDALALPGHGDAALVVEQLFEHNGWTGGWRDGVYDYHHFHSTAHEVLGCYAGCALLQLGGPSGVSVELARGDVLVVPAGVAHKSLSCTPDFSVVGAYAHGAAYDMQRSGANQADVRERIARVAFPDRDPVYGQAGPLREHWTAA